MTCKNTFVVVLALLVGVGVGMFIDSHTGSENKDKNMVHAHTHGTYEVPVGVAAPTVDLVIHEDPKGGYNVQILTTNFRFAPENVSTDYVEGEGHAHIYVDGVKVNRVYGEWYHLGELREGTHEIAVNLSGNDHTELLVNGKHVEDVETVFVVHDDDEHHDGHVHTEDSEKHIEGDAMMKK